VHVANDGDARGRDAGARAVSGPRDYCATRSLRSTSVRSCARTECNLEPRAPAGARYREA
jgi:hypothetical protein